MWEKDNNSRYMDYVNSYLKYGTSQMDNMGIDVVAAFQDILGKDLSTGQLDKVEIKEDRRKYLLIRR